MGCMLSQRSLPKIVSHFNILHTARDEKVTHSTICFDLSLITITIDVKFKFRTAGYWGTIKIAITKMNNRPLSAV